jgi:hypothetical protein
MVKSLSALSIVFLLAAPMLSAGVVLWDQAPATAGVSLTSQVFTDYPDFSSYLVMDVTVPASGWTIESVTTYFKAGTFFADSGYTLPVQLVILPVSGDLPDASADPSTATQYDGVYSFSGDLARIDVEGLDITLAPGDYWIGVSPYAAADYEGQFYLLSSSSTVGRSAAWRDPGGGFGFGTDWIPTTTVKESFTEGNLHIEGTLNDVPEPSTMGCLALALIVGGGLRRRARKNR